MAIQAVHSFLEQTWPHKELVVVNNGFGLEGYSRLLDEIPLPDNVRAQEIVLDSRKRSLGRLWNIGLAAASGDAFVYWDDDNWSHPARLTALMSRWEPGSFLLSTTQLRYCIDTNTAYIYENHEGCSGLAVFPQNDFWFDPEPEGISERHGEDAIFILSVPESRKRIWPNREHAHYFIRMCHRGTGGNDRSFRSIMRKYAADKYRDYWELDPREPEHLTLEQAVYLADILTRRYGVPESRVPAAVRAARRSSK